MPKKEESLKLSERKVKRNYNRDTASGKTKSGVSDKPAKKPTKTKTSPKLKKVVKRKSSKKVEEVKPLKSALKKTVSTSNLKKWV